MSDIHVINVDAVMELVTEYAASWGRNELARLTRVNGDKHQIRMYELRDAIRAMLEPHDAARLRDNHGEAWSAVRKLLNRYDGNTDEGIAIADGVASAAVDAVIRVIGGAR